MKLYPEDVKQAVEQSKAIAEQSKQAVKPPAENPDHIAAQWKAAKRGQK